MIESEEREEEPGLQPGRDRAIRLFEYLRRLAELRTPTVRDVAAYPEVVWFGEIPAEPECRVVTRVPPAGPLQWLTIDRPRRSPPPELPVELLAWADARELADSSSQPELHAIVEEVEAEADGFETELEPVRVVDRPEAHPEVVEAWADYLPRWERWAAEDRRLRPIFEVYKRLFDVEQLGNQLGEQYETVVGIGLLTWSGPTGEIRRHLLTVPADLRFDAETGRISLGQPADGARPRLEEDMVQGGRLPSRDVKRSLDERLLEAEPWDRATIDGVLRAWVHSADTRGSYEPAVAAPERAGDAPQVHFAPAVILRRRSPRSLIEFYSSVVEQLRDEATTVPPAVHDIIEILEEQAAGDGTLAGLEPPAVEPPATEEASAVEAPAPPARPADREIYFPLPSNDEQWRIVERLERHRGVVVQGPPGTGKSHTIANLISHLAAVGKRVLVTSHTGRALEVLKGKLPPDVAKLCVSVVGDGRRGTGDLERSIQALVARTADPDWTDDAIDERVAELRQRLRDVGEERHELLARQRAIREREIERHALPYGGYEGKLAEIARRLRAEEARYGWLTDRPTDPSPLTAQDARELLELLRRLRGEAGARSRQAIPERERLPAPEEAARRFEELAEAERAAERAAAPALAVRATLEAASYEQLHALATAITTLGRARELALRGREPWLAEAAGAVLEERAGEWQELARLTHEGLRSLEDRARQADAVQVRGHEGLDPMVLLGQARQLAEHLERGGRVGGLIKAPPVRAARQLLERVRVDGLVPDSPALLQRLVAVLEAEAGLARIERSWGSRLPSSQATTWSGRRARLVDAGDALDRVLELDALRRAADGAAQAIPGLVPPLWSDEARVAELEDGLRSLEASSHVIALAAGIEDAATACRAAAALRGAAPECARAATALQQRDPVAYTAAFEGLEAARELRTRADRRDALLELLRQQAPELVRRLLEQPDDPAWDERLADLERAWDWARAERWCQGMVSIGEERAIGERLLVCDQRLLKLNGELGANLAWRHCLRRMTDEHSRRLGAYQAAMRRYGKGTGKHAPRHLADARRHMEACQDAVPAWIMPTYRVAETIPARPHAFDVVIVDEASQSGVDALLLLWLAPKVVVVGDDRQISPDNVGLDRRVVERFQSQYLPDIELRDLLGLDNSLFDQAASRYRGRIWLQEHFRCMPEIIQFSNRLSYGDHPLVPLRQFGTDRLEPLRSIHVDDAWMRESEQSKINEEEAEAIVERIAKCCADPAYDGASMGVISLLGSGQAMRIRNLLIERIGPEEMVARRLKCGTAYDFQGDERSVMFLSMVVTPSPDGRRLPALGGKGSEQRFNVAASRAQDQLWLFHSVELHDLNPECVRWKLLSHFLNPPAALEAPEVPGEVHPEILQEPFDSLFEQQVFLRLQERGHTVVPQHRVHGFRIDLVVLGEHSRLAVECDGDEWHGPEQYARDMAHQRDLERCGWRFFRLRASEFYRDPDAALEPLWTLLHERGIGVARTS